MSHSQNNASRHGIEQAEGAVEEVVEAEFPGNDQGSLSRQDSLGKRTGNLLALISTFFDKI
jgi:hypothetical protein